MFIRFAHNDSRFFPYLIESITSLAMNRYETYRVCKACFDRTKARNRPTLEKSKQRGICNTCRGDWVGINVGYYHPDNKYYEIHRRLYYSENRLCSFNVTELCDRGDRCRYAHNRLELELWIEQEKMFTDMKSPSWNQLRCVICKVVFKDVPSLEMHLQSREHVRRTESLRILPEVGSSLKYIGPIRARPKVLNTKDTYELCVDFTKNGKCDFFTGCKRAHSEEELKVWLEAQEAEEEARKIKKEQISSKYKSQSSKSRSSSSASCSSGNKNRSRTQSTPSSYSSSSRYQSPSSSYSSSSRYQSPSSSYSSSSRYQSPSSSIHSGNRSQSTSSAYPSGNRSQSTSSGYHSDSRSQSTSSASSNTSNSRPQSFSSQNQDGACKYPSSSNWNQDSRSRSEMSSSEPEPESDLGYYWRVRGEIEFIRIEDVVRNRPEHIEILCNNHLEQTMEESPKEFNWVFRIKSSEREILHGIILYNDHNMFKLEGVHKGVEGGKYCEIKFPYIPNRNCHQLQQKIDSTTLIDVNLLFKPKIGQHQVYIVVEFMEGGLVARKVNVTVKGVTFKKANETFKAETKPPLMRQVPSVEDTLPINWEQGYRLINTQYFQNKHRMPDNMEERVRTGFYDKINDMIVKEKYFLRFQTLLHLEEFEHRKSLSKYDLLDYEITYKTVEKEILIENDYGDERVETAEVNRRFIRFDLNHQLFEGYRAFRPPKIAYIIPNHTKTAYECYCVRTAIDYLIFSITIDTIEACEESGGLAMVRFMPKRDEYEKMHYALDNIKPLRDTILFPTWRDIRTPEQWDEHHLLRLLNYEILTTTQKEAVHSIINSKYTSIPTIICGPFGCGKTKTLAIAAKLIALTFYNSGILIVTKTNTCANLYIDLLADYFDGIDMLDDRRSRKPKLYRHFAAMRNISWDKKMQPFTNIRDGAYERLPLNDLKRCSIVVTTIVGCSNLILPKDRDCTKYLFTHILIDEAAQLIEPEACIPLSLAGLDTKIALAGDVRQSRPLILSKQGRQFHLDQSLLERFETLPEYQPRSPHKCNITLLENFRSSVEIVCFLSELFYDGSLRSNPPTLEGPTDFPSLSFLHVKGEERRLYGFPSFYNEEEAELTIGVLQKFANLGVRVENMAVLTTYKSQVRLIYDYLRYEERKCGDLGHFRYKNQSCRKRNCVNKRTIDVRNLEGIQGMEYDLIVVNTVRTTNDVPKDISLEERLDLGLLDDVTQFNTILTRARGWVVVIGDSDCLTNIGNCSNVWSKYVDACEGNQGFFTSLEDFEVKRSKEKGKKPERKNSKMNEKDRKTSSTGAGGGMVPPEVQTEEMYQTKFNALHEFINICEQEITQPHANTDVIQAINNQLNFARIARENLERQTFEVKKIKEREEATVKRAKPADRKRTGNSVGSFEDVFPPEEHTDETYQNKFNLLQNFIAVCQQEISQVHASTEITAAINDQLRFAKLVLDNLERQRYLEQ